MKNTFDSKWKENVASRRDEDRNDEIRAAEIVDKNVSDREIEKRIHFDKTINSC